MIKEADHEKYERKMHTGELYLPGDKEIVEDQINGWIVCTIII